MKISTTADIRNFLLDNMMKTAEGKVEIGQAKAMCNFAQQVYNTIKLEMQFATLKQAGKIDKVEALQLTDNSKTRNLRDA